MKKFYITLICLLIAAVTLAQTTAFTYQGQIKDANGPINTYVQWAFELFDAVSGGTQIGATIYRYSPMTNGLFTVSLDFGAAAFTGSDRWLEVHILTNGSTTDTTLLPRQQLTSIPYSVYSQSTKGIIVSPSGTTVGIPLNNALELGYNVPGKDVSAGRLGYQLFTPGAVDMVGAGTASIPRRIKFWNEGGASFTGNIGIGTDSPQASLHLKGNAGLLNMEGTNQAYMQWYPQGLGAGRKGYFGYTPSGSNTLTIANEILYGPIILAANTAGVGINMTPTYNLDVNGIIRCTGFINSSDARLKKNIEPLPNALAAVMSLRGVQYDWKNPGALTNHQYGFIAQEVQKTLPDLVYKDKDGLYAMSYINIIPLTVEAIKTQQSEIDKLKKENARLKAQNEAILKRLDRLEAKGK